MRFFSPTFRSRPFGHRLLTSRIVVLVGLFTWLTPALFGLLMVLISAVLLPPTDYDSPWFALSAIGGFLIFAPIYGIVLVPLGLLIGAWAMRFGVAGWASMVTACIALAVVFAGLFQWLIPENQSFDGLVLFLPIVLVHAIAMWIATRYLCPQALHFPTDAETLP